MAYSKTLFLLALLFAVVLIMSPKVLARDLAETAHTQVSVEDAKEDGYGYGKGGKGGYGYGGKGKGGKGGYGGYGGKGGKGKGKGKGKPPGHGGHGAGEDVEGDKEGDQN